MSVKVTNVKVKGHYSQGQRLQVKVKVVRGVFILIYLREVQHWGVFIKVDPLTSLRQKKAQQKSMEIYQKNNFHEIHFQCRKGHL